MLLDRDEHFNPVVVTGPVFFLGQLTAVGNSGGAEGGMRKIEHLARAGIVARCKRMANYK